MSRFKFLKNNEKLSSITLTAGRPELDPNRMDTYRIFYMSRESIDESRWDGIIAEQEEILITRMNNRQVIINPNMIFHNIIEEYGNRFILHSEIR